MNVPLIDAEAVKEFLGQAEPMLGDSVLLEMSRKLGERSRRLREEEWWRDWARLWDLCPATHRLPAPERALWESRLATVRQDVAAGRATEVLDAVQALPDRPAWLLDWATFWLHASHPDRFPWWARWVYDPEGRTGALPLLLEEPMALAGLGLGDGYAAMARATGYLGAVLGAIRRLTAVEEDHRPTVALGITYVVYLYTVAAWKMTNEFTGVLGPFPTVLATLLGIRRWEGERVGSQGQAR